MKITAEQIQTILIEKGQTNFKILEISITGSKAFFNIPERKSDTDVLVIVDKLKERHLRFKIGEYDFFIYSQEFWTSLVNLEENDFWSFWAIFYICNKRVYGNFKIDVNFFDNKEKYRQLIKRVLYNSAINSDLKYNRFPYKKFSLPYIILKMYENNSLEITQDMIDKYTLLHTIGDDEAVKWICNNLELKNERLEKLNVEINLETVTKLLADKGEINFEILEITPTGSRLFLSEELCGDTDLIVVGNGFSQDCRVIHYHEENTIYDFWVYELEYFKKRINLDLDNLQHMIQVGMRPWEVEKRVYGQLDINFDLFGVKDKYINILKEALYDYAFNPDIEVWRIDYKKFVKAYIILKCYENNSLEITDEILNGIKSMYANTGYDLVKWVGKQLGYDTLSSVKYTAIPSKKIQTENI